MLYIRIVLMTVCVIYLIIFICYLILSKKAIMLFALNSVSGLLFLSLLKLSENYLPVEININVVSEMLGHNDVVTTRIYNQVLKDNIKKIYIKYI